MDRESGAASAPADRRRRRARGATLAQETTRCADTGARGKSGRLPDRATGAWVQGRTPASRCLLRVAASQYSQATSAREVSGRCRAV